MILSYSGLPDSRRSRGASIARLYNDLAYLWPIISPPGEYGDEAAFFGDVVQELLGPERHSLLELGVGGGHNLSHLTSDFDCVAVDLSPEMTDLSEELNPGVEHHVGDMRDIRLERVFDAVLVHDAVSYLLTVQDLEETFGTAAAHLRPGGVLMVALHAMLMQCEGEKILLLPSWPKDTSRRRK